MSRCLCSEMAEVAQKLFKPQEIMNEAAQAVRDMPDGVKTQIRTRAEARPLQSSEELS